MTGVGNVYGEALYLLAKEEDRSKTILEELKALDESFSQEPDFLRLLSSPNLPKAERCQILDNSFRGKIDPYLLNFMKILTEKGYIRHFSDCRKGYTLHYNQDNGILSVTAVTAVALSAEQADKLTGKTIELVNRVDPGIYGGVRLDYDGQRLDDTVAHRLENIRNLLKNTVL